MTAERFSSPFEGLGFDTVDNPQVNMLLGQRGQSQEQKDNDFSQSRSIQRTASHAFQRPTWPPGLAHQIPAPGQRPNRKAATF